jgi:copper chaperone CopZ
MGTAFINGRATRGAESCGLRPHKMCNRAAHPDLFIIAGWIHDTLPVQSMGDLGGLGVLRAAGRSRRRASGRAAIIHLDSFGDRTWHRTKRDIHTAIRAIPGVAGVSANRWLKRITVHLEGDVLARVVEAVELAGLQVIDAGWINGQPHARPLASAPPSPAPPVALAHDDDFMDLAWPGRI